MHFLQRHEAIIQSLEKDKMVKVTELSSSLSVTEKTIRQDLIVLENKGVLKRIHGGAILPDSAAMLSVEKRQASFLYEKKQAAKAAAAFIKENDTILLDGGSTMLELAKQLIHHKITVVTNDLKIAHALLNASKIQLIVLGGARNASAGLTGPIAMDALEKIWVQNLFLGTTAADIDKGLTVFSNDQAEYKRMIMNRAEQITLVTDHTKFGQTALIQYAEINRVDRIITNNELSSNWKCKLKETGIPVTYTNE
ncbi:DeoR/GlpR family DNA-binding transcription regulator [Metabacillus sp. 113a]|uniref:DeoR/GlpR family DNA-binding transcription regulator n=1 Tax=Metabacillus sp. 113a TaxID=3404706 RepID=UPI003CF15D13